MSVTQNVTADHTLTVRIGPGGDITAKITCHADDWSQCRNALDDSGVLEHVNFCNPGAWVAASDVLDCYDGPDTDLRSGPITYHWQHISPTDSVARWSYAPEPTARTVTIRTMASCLDCGDLRHPDQIVDGLCADCTAAAAAYSARQSSSDTHQAPATTSNGTAKEAVV